MSLNLVLNNAISGLTASQTAVTVTSQNVANGNTAGYSRQIIQFEQQTNGNVRNGVKVSDIDRIVDVFVTRELRAATGDTGTFAARQQVFQQIIALFGSPGNDSTLGNDLTRFSAAVERLALNPEETALRFDVVAAGESLAANVRSLASNVQSLRADIDQQVKDGVDIVNDRLRQIYELNRAIAKSQAAGVSSPDLGDRRDKAILELSEQIGISAVPRENGEVNIFSTGGFTLVDAQMRQFTYSPAAAVDAGSTFGEMRIVPVDSTTLEPLSDGDVIVTSGTSATVVSNVASGRLSGLIGMRDRELPNLGDQVEAFAATIRDRLNAVHNDGVGFPAPASLTGTRDVATGDAFAGTGTVRVAVVDATGNVVGAPVDLDLGALGATSVNGLITALNTALGANASASIINGKLAITATDPTNGIAINEGDSQVTATARGLSHHFGLNDFYVGSRAADLAVRADIVTSPNRLATAELSATAVAGETGITVGDNRVAVRLAEAFETGISFDAIGGLPATTYTLGSYAASMVGLAATRASATEDDLSHRAALLDNLAFRAGAISGVNIDEELSNLILYQNAYQASARVLTTAVEMFDTLIDMVR